VPRYFPSHFLMVARSTRRVAAMRVSGVPAAAAVRATARAAVVAISQAKNQSGRDGFLMGVLLGPVGIIIALCLPKLPARQGTFLDWVDAVERLLGRDDGDLDEFHALWKGGRTPRQAVTELRNEPPALPPMPKPYEPDVELL
jgi:hypothetical protein